MFNDQQACVHMEQDLLSDFCVSCRPQSTLLSALRIAAAQQRLHQLSV